MPRDGRVTRRWMGNVERFRMTQLPSLYLDAFSSNVDSAIYFRFRTDGATCVSALFGRQIIMALFPSDHDAVVRFQIGGLVRKL